jgi:acetyltransferase-like isoleucine patch superfamily enzyme
VLRRLWLGVALAWRTLRRVWFRLLLPLVEPGIRLGRGVDIGPRTELRIASRGQIVIDDGVSLECDVLIYAERGEVRIGRNGFVGRGSQIVAHECVSIGPDALIATGVVIRDADHRFDDPARPMREQGHEVRPIHIGADVWLGAHAVVTAGSTIGRGCVIGANAVVHGEIPPESVAVGIPARVVKQRRPVLP